MNTDQNLISRSFSWETASFEEAEEHAMFSSVMREKEHQPLSYDSAAISAASVRLLRHNLGMTQQQLAYALNVNRRTVAKWEVDGAPKKWRSEFLLLGDR